MVDRPFTYDDKLLEECAGSSLAAFVETLPGFEDDVDESFQRSFRSPSRGSGDESCLLLFQEHSAHFGRRHKPSDHQLEKILDSESHPETVVSYRLGKKLENFVRSVSFVHRHNEAVESDRKGHRVSLNRFSDVDPDGFIVSDTRNEEGRRLLDWDFSVFDDDVFKSSWGADMDVGLITTLTSSAIIQQMQNLGIGKGSMNKLHPTKKKKKNVEVDEPPRTVSLPIDHQERFETPAVEGQDGALLSIKENSEHKRERKHPKKSKHKYHGRDNATDPDSALLDRAYDEMFAEYLNWATEANPDGVPIVHDAFDQGACGACWAFAAAGSLEASASRKAAFDAFNYYQEKNAATDANFTSADEGIAFAQQIERESIKMANLSIQELLDCDQVADQGCSGGNPLLAFYFIHRFGLTSWTDYPYVGFRDTCKKDLVLDPIATAKSWGIISPNHEKHMELALRYIGPIAVGVNGANRHFLAYSGGIFDRPHCKQGANHALLITGYGQEESEDGSIVKYWIARNSWGLGWGENGYVRVKRGPGSKGIPGVCGIARSPSVALGGALIGRATPSFAEAEKLLVPRASSAEQGQLRTICTRVGLGQEGACAKTMDWIDTHYALSLGLVGILIAMLAIWPLTADCRKRRRRRRRRSQMRRSAAEEQKENTETVPLISDQEEQKDDTQEATERAPLISDQLPVSYGS